MGTEAKTVKAGVVMIMKQIFFLAAMCVGTQTLAADDAAAKCDAARDQAKRHYGSLRQYFDALNDCLSRKNEDANQCKVALSEQQTALDARRHAEQLTLHQSEQVEIGAAAARFRRRRRVARPVRVRVD